MKINNELRYFLYARKSQDEKDRQVLSIPAQIDEAKSRFPDLNIIEVIEESASAFHPDNRPKFAYMLEQIRLGRADGILAWHPDRLSRNAPDAADIIYMLDRGIVKDLKFTSFNFENTPEGKWMLGIILSQSKYFSDKLSKDIRRGNLTKLKQGELPGKARQGYKNVRTDDGHKIVVPREPHFSHLKNAWKLLLSGAYTVPMILNKLHDEWGYRTPSGNKLSRSALYDVFTNEFYAGWIDRKEGRFKGNHQKMITLDEYERAQLILGARGKPRRKKYDWSYTGLVRCGECGSSISADPKFHCYCYYCHKKFVITSKRSNCPGCHKSAYGDGMKLLTYVYYRCSKNKVGVKCKQEYVRIENLEHQISSFLEAIELPEAFTAWAIKWLKFQHEKEIDDHNRELESLQKAYQQTQTQLDNLVDMRMKGFIDDAQYKDKQTEVVREREKVKERLEGFEHRVNQWMELTEETLNFATLAPKRFKEASIEERRQMLAEIGSNLILTNGTLSILAKRPYEIIYENLTKKPEIKTITEPNQYPAISTQKDSFTPIFQEMCSMLADIRTYFMTSDSPICLA